MRKMSKSLAMIAIAAIIGVVSVQAQASIGVIPATGIDVVGLAKISIVPTSGNNIFSQIVVRNVVPVGTCSPTIDFCINAVGRTAGVAPRQAIGVTGSLIHGGIGLITKRTISN